LIGYGASAVNPYLVYEVIAEEAGTSGGGAGRCARQVS
jgi:hypothetical protein